MAAPLTFGELRQGTTSWVKHDLNRTLRVGAIAFAVSWAVNFIVITNWGAALGNVIGGATNGTQGVGAAYMAIMSLVVTSLIVYGMEAGWSDLRKSFAAIPKAVGRMFRQHGVRMWSIIFWGTAVTLLTSGILDPTLAAAFGLGFLAFAPTAITGLLGKLITGVWTWVIGLFAPKARPHTPGLGGQLVGMVGAGFGFLLASQATETAFQLIAAGALIALSYFVLLNKSSPAASTSAFLLIGLAFWIGGEGIAQAFQGCCGESHHHALDPGMEAAGLSAIAGLAGGVAGIIGAGVGAVLATHPMDPSTWDDRDSGSLADGSTLPRDPIREPSGSTAPVDNSDGDPSPGDAGLPLPDVGEVIAESATPTRRTRSGKLPDGSNPGAYAEWFGQATTGSLPPHDVTALESLIRGDRNEVTVSGKLLGKWSQLLDQTEPRTDGVAVVLPNGDRILVRVRAGRVEVKHEASLVSVLVDKVDVGLRIETIVAGAQSPVESFNRSIAKTGRQTESIRRSPDGSINIRTR